MMSLAILHSRSLLVGVFGASDFQGWWGMYLGTLTKAGQHAWLLADGALVLISVLALLAAVAVAAWNLQRFWQETPPSASQLWVEEKFCTPILWVSFFHRWMRHKLEKNPIGWLETRTWSGRLVTWGWFALMITLYSEALAKSSSALWDEVQTFMTFLLMGVMAVSAAGSFQRERETGVLELLLVSPLSVGQIIGGRLRGLWSQFLPAFAVLLGVWMFVAGLYPQFIMNWEIIPFYCSSFLTLPVIGLYCSLRRRSFISAFLFTVFLGFVVPFGLRLAMNWFMGDILGIRFEGYTNGFRSTVVIYGPAGSPQMFAPTPTNSLAEGLLRLTHSPWILILVQGFVAWRVGRLLYRDMERRNFPLSRTIA